MCHCGKITGVNTLSWWIHLAAPVFGCCCCAFGHAVTLSHCHLSQGHFRRADSSLMLLVAPVLFLLWQVKISAATLEHPCRWSFIKNTARCLSVDCILSCIFHELSVTVSSLLPLCIAFGNNCVQQKHSQKSSIFLFAYWLLRVLFVLKCHTIGLDCDNLSSGYLNKVVWVEKHHLCEFSKPRLKPDEKVSPLEKCKTALKPNKTHASPCLNIHKHGPAEFAYISVYSEGGTSHLSCFGCPLAEQTLFSSSSFWEAPPQLLERDIVV